MTDIDLKKAFYMEPKEIVKYFESKGLKPSFDWYEVYEDAHAKAFTVAKMTQADLLKDTHDMLTTAIKEGWSEGKFKKNATELFQIKGWVGKKEVINPKTGKRTSEQSAKRSGDTFIASEVKTVELGTPRRIKQIFQCNMHSAYAVGKYKSQMEKSDVAPYFQYSAILDGKTRPEHKAMHGKVFRYDDPIWNTMYPPNGWHCRCTVKQLTKGDVRRKGLTVESSENHLREVTEIVGGEEKPNTVYTFSKNGNIYELKPDAGWGTNQALNSSNYDLLLYDKMKDFSYGLKTHLIDELNTTPISINKVQRTIEKGISEVVNQTFKANKQPVTLAWLTPDILKFMEKEKLLNVGAVINLSDNDVIHLLRTNKNVKQKLTTEQLRRMPVNFRKPTSVYYDTQDNALIYIQKLPKEEIENEKDIIKFVVKPITNKKQKQNVWELTTAGKANLKRDIQNQTRYKKIELSKDGLAFPSSDGL